MSLTDSVRGNLEEREREMKINRREKSSRHCKHMANGALTFTAHVLRSEVYRESGELKRDI